MISESIMQKLGKKIILLLPPIKQLKESRDACVRELLSVKVTKIELG
jgi:hypothetical protein